ncbi:hypothetical protein QJS10_CPA03g01363 [Acorus calamus]|uniref:Uncharacterized protein n=1 Tax=Acorus calamus TaxID=4465 RepID=A0AAV9FA39_ACOCL|nr:hypothetical protein QJS10_CPA03g01363 [Acorus calamus]
MEQDETYRSNSQTYDEAGKIESNTDDFPSTDDPKVTITPEFRHGEVSSARTVALWICAALAFGIGVGLKEGVDKASEFFAGYLLEQSLSVDNLFVFVLIFKYFKVPIMYQNRVLSYGIAGAVIFRAIMILLGAATIQLFASEDEDTDLANNFIVKTCQKFIPITNGDQWVYPLGGIRWIVEGAFITMEVTGDNKEWHGASYYDGDRFLTMKEGVWQATPLLLTVAVIELSDIAFARFGGVLGCRNMSIILTSENYYLDANTFICDLATDKREDEGEIKLKYEDMIVENDNTVKVKALVENLRSIVIKAELDSADMAE